MRSAWLDPRAHGPAELVNSAGRHAISLVVIGVDELLVFVMIWMALISVLVVTVERSHIGLDVIVRHLRLPVRAALEAVNYVVNALSGANVAKQSFSFTACVMCVNIILLLVGRTLDPTSVILVLAPPLIPLVNALGTDPIHFGVIMTVNIAIGMVYAAARSQPLCRLFRPGHLA